MLFHYKLIDKPILIMNYGECIAYCIHCHTIVAMNLDWNYIVTYASADSRMLVTISDSVGNFEQNLANQRSVLLYGVCFGFVAGTGITGATGPRGNTGSTGSRGGTG